MLPKRYRLQKNYQFKYIYSHGVSFYTKPIVLIRAKSKPGSLRIGISVSNKTGKAVFRNRIKRLLREAVREHLPHLTKGFNYIFAASSKYDFKGVAYAAVRDAVGALIKKNDDTHQKEKV